MKLKKSWLRKGLNSLKTWTETKNFIKESFHNGKRIVNILIKSDAAKKRIDLLLTVSFNVLLTGLVISYVINHRNFISYGLLSWIVTYYIEWLIKLIKKPYKD